MIELEHPNGKKRDAYRRVKYTTKGHDFETLFSDAANVALGLINKVDLSLPTSGASNPGNTFMGKGRNKITTFEGVLDNHGRINKPYMKLTHLWNGWKIKKKKLLKLVKKINEKYNFVFLPDLLFNETKSVILYKLKLELAIHKEGIDSLMMNTYTPIKNIFKNHGVKKKRSKKWAERMAQRYVNIQRKFIVAYQKKDQKEYSKQAIKLYEFLEKKLNLKGILAVVGGKENIFISARLDGFRNGDENGDRAVISNTIGEFGRRSPQGILLPLMSSIGVTEGEFFLNWLIGGPL